MLYFCTFLSLLQVLSLCTSFLHLGPVQAIWASQDREESLTHIWRVNSWWASEVQCRQHEITCTAALSRLMAWRSLYKSTVFSERQQCEEKSGHIRELTDLNRSQGVTCLLHESPGRVSLPAQPSLETVSGRCHLLQFEALLLQFT